VARRARLDAELVRRGLARSRQQAADYIAAGRVSVAGHVATKPATQVEISVAILVAEDDTDPGYASRGGYKLAGALDAFTPDGLTVEGRRCLDAGASAGGFTDVLLRRGARQVVAVDVGYGQLAWRLRTDPRVVIHDRTNVRELTAQLVGGGVDVVVADLSFISLTLVLPALAACLNHEGDLVPMIKPQFEVGRDRVGPGGVVTERAWRADAVRRVASAAADLGLGVRGLVASPLPGPAGNLEYFVWLKRGAPPLEDMDLELVMGTRPPADPGASPRRGSRQPSNARLDERSAPLDTSQRRPDG
jgi:23S rRNA (cytidine1920-2'-O)/16S rRNA (cytidine1409-2'-O)-methyltransferase